MMKLFRKLTAGALAVAATLTMAVSCGGGGGNSAQNPSSESTKQPTSEELATKTTINVAVFNAELRRIATQADALRVPTAKRELPTTDFPQPGTSS